VDKESVSGDNNPRAWARPDPEGDPWHEYWDPAGKHDPRRRTFRYQGPVDSGPDPAREADARRRLGRRIAIGYVVVAPIAIVVSLLLHGFYSTQLGAVFGAAICTVGLIRIRWYGERALGFTIAMVAFILVWAVIAAVRIAA
jgi:hypothetical protein